MSSIDALSLRNSATTSPQSSVTSNVGTSSSSVNSEPADRFESTTTRGTSSIGVVRNTPNPVAVEKPQEALAVNDIPQPGYWYNAKKYMWASIVSLAFKAAKLLPIAKPKNEKLKMVTLKDLDPAVAIDNIHTTQDVPEAEKSKAKQMLYAAIRWLSSAMPINSEGMPPISSNFDAMLEEAYPEKYKALLPAPVIPPEIATRPDDIVGTMALSGPFAAYVEKVPGTDNLYKIDLERYSNIAVRDGLKALGGSVFMEYSPEEKRMNTRYIKYQGRVYPKDGPGWEAVQKIALCTLSTDATVVRHLTDTHLLVAGTYAGVTTNTLDAQHPVRALIHPHLHQTLSTNNYKASNLVKNDDSVFPKIFSYNKDTIQKLMKDYADGFDIRKMDPALDAEMRGFEADSEVEYPYLENTTKLWKITQDYVSSYLDAYYESDEAIAQDPQIQAWYAALNKYIPNGVTQYAPTITKENIAKLCTLLIHTGSVEHENVGNITWNYTTLHQYIPSLVPADGSNVPVDVYQRYINTSVLTFIPLNQLMDDVSHIALDEKGAACMQRYRENLAELQKEMEKKPFSYSAMYPKALEGSVST